MLLDSDDVMDLVPADHVIDVTGRPERMPCVNIGEGQTVFRRFDATTYADIHVWVQEPGLVTAKLIADAIVDTISVDAQINGVLHLDGFICHDLSVDRSHYLRDPHGPFSHAVLSVVAIMKAN